MSDQFYKMGRRIYTNEYYEEYNKGYNHYIKNNWRGAMDHLNNSMKILGKVDGPSKKMKEFIIEHDESHWKGYRDED